MRSSGVVLLPLFSVVHDRFPSGAMQTYDMEQYQKDDTECCNLQPPPKTCSHRAALIWGIFVDCTSLSLIFQSVHLHNMMQGWQLGNRPRQTAGHMGQVGERRCT